MRPAISPSPARHSPFSSHNPLDASGGRRLWKPRADIGKCAQADDKVCTPKVYRTRSSWHSRWLPSGEGELATGLLGSIQPDMLLLAHHRCCSAMRPFETGWGSAPGRAAVEIMRRACRREATHWTRTAGWMTDEGLAAVWEQMDRLVQTGRFADAPGLLRVVVRRAYAGEAAAAQTGFGSPTTRGLIGAIKRHEALPVDTHDWDELVEAPEEAVDLVAPPWMRTLAAVLAVEGWQWPVPPLYAVMASAAGVAKTGRRCRSAMAAHDTGVPASTWSALDLLTFGSGPGCQPESRTLGVSVQIDLFGAAGIRSNKTLMRIVQAAVEGRPVRTGHRLAGAA